MGTLNKGQKLTLRRDGFTKAEVKAYDEAKGPDGTLQDFAFGSETFKSVRKSRRNYVADLKERGWIRAEIDGRISSYYGLKAGRSPFDFLKLEYAPSRKLSDFQDATRRVIRSRITRTLGKAYGRRLRPSVRPKYLPERPRYPTPPPLPTAKKTKYTPAPKTKYKPIKPAARTKYLPKRPKYQR